MGYFINNIAEETKTPATVSLAGSPNYIRFERNSGETDKPLSMKIKIDGKPATQSSAEFTIKETKTGMTTTFKGTTDVSKVDSLTFFYSDNEGITAENIRSCLMADDFFRGNFKITVPFVTDGSTFKNGKVIHIVSFGTGDKYNFTVQDFNTGFLTVTENIQSENKDSISDGDDCEIQLDFYGNNGMFPGTGSPVTDLDGDFMATMTKFYAGDPIWFDVNSFLSGQNTYSPTFLGSNGWEDAGTITDFRFVAKRKKGVNHETFYYSDIYYALTGYARSLEYNNLSKYVLDIYSIDKVRPLTNQPTLNHVPGQTQYFNFIMSDKLRGSTTTDEPVEIGFLYRLYNQSGNFICKKITTHTNHTDLYAVNTIRLDIDGVMAGYDNVGKIEVCLYNCTQEKEISFPLMFDILPECLYKVKEFAFLNALGGWSSFNFSATEQTNFKASTNNYYKTGLPDATISDEIESIAYKDVTEQFTVKTMPITREVSEWLKELSASVAVYEIKTKRFVIIDEFTLKYNTDDDLFQYEMKYRYSDSYNSK